MGGSNAYLKTIIKIKQYYGIKYTVESLMHGERSVNAVGMNKVGQKLWGYLLYQGRRETQLEVTGGNSGKETGWPITRAPSRKGRGLWGAG